MLLGLAGAAGAAEPHAVLELAPPRLVTLSPDGGRLAWVKGLPPTQVLMSGASHTPLERHRQVGPLALPTDRLEWLDSEHLLVIGRSPSEHRWIRIHLASGRQRTILQADAADRRGPRLLAIPQPDLLLVSDDRRSPWLPDLYEWRAGREQRVERNAGGLFRWLATPAGVVQVARRWSSQTGGPRYEWLWRPDPQRNWRSILSHDLNEAGPRALAWEPGGRGLLLATADQVMRLDLDRGTVAPLEILPPGVGRPVELAFAPDGQLAMVASEDRLPLLQASREPWRTDLARLKTRFDGSGLQARWLGATPWGRTWTVTGDRTAQALFHATRGGVESLGRWTVPGATPMQPVTLVQPGGPALPGYLSQPSGSAIRGLVLLIHGGPWTRDRWGWQLETQLLTAAGFTVLQVNFRGSAGLGHDWLLAGRQGWHSVMVEDLARSVRWARARGLHAGGPVCAMGSSFGGYAALMLLARDDQVVDCAVARAPVSDLAGQIQHLGQVGHWRGHAEWSAMVGDPLLEADRLRRESPLGQVPALRGRPLLLAHGTDDRTVLPRQTRALAAQLASADAQHQLVMLEGQGHDLRSVTARHQWYTQVVRFLSTQPGPGSQESP